MYYKNSPIIGFEPQTADVGSNCSNNWVATTAQNRVRLSG